MRRDKFIETDNVKRFNRAMAVLMDIGKGDARMCVVQGPAGRGKTVTAQEYHARGNSIFLRVFEGWSQFEFLQQVAWEVSGVRPGSRNKCRQVINEKLGDHPQPIIVDEADRLSMARIEDLRDIHDYTASPIIMVGEQDFYNQLTHKKRVESRISQLVRFEPVVPDDVALFAHKAAGVLLEPAAAEWLVKKVNGCFRDISNRIETVEEWCKANDQNVVSLTTIQKIKFVEVAG